jgi:ElaB/YqjD/DUF883 family membrane-anchored ribosome-binding protein
LHLDASDKIDELTKSTAEATNKSIQYLSEISQISLESTNQTIRQLNETLNRITDNVVSQTNDTLDEINQWFKEKYCATKFNFNST